MSVTDSGLVSLHYGGQSYFSCRVDAWRIVTSRPAPQPNPQYREALRSALLHPLDFPPMAQAVIPDDRVVLALDRHTPESAGILAEVWRILDDRRVRPENVLVIQPAARVPVELPDPRRALPDGVRECVQWKVHAPVNRSDCAYLATTTGGERIYLARDVTDADVVISIGAIRYDPVIGCRGTSSVFYPGLSSSDAFSRVHGQGHGELGPGEERPVRQLIDEVAWLLGTQFSIQVIPSAAGGIVQVVAGLTDSVYRHGKRLLDEHWLIELDTRAEIVVAAVDADAAGHGWEQIGAALSAARALVSYGGRIVILSELRAELGNGLELVRQSSNPSDAIKPLRAEAPPDLIAATQLADAVDWADVYLKSKLHSDLVEDLFMVPVENAREITRLLSGGETCAFLSSAQHTFGRIRSA